MAIQDRLLVLCDGADPAALTAYGDADANIKYIGSKIDTRLSNVYNTYPSGSLNYRFPHDKPLWVNILNSGAAASITGSSNRYIFQLVMDAASSGARATGDVVIAHGEVLGSDFVKGYTLSLPIPVGVVRRRYLSVAMGSVAASSDEAARIDAWISLDPVHWEALTEGNN